MELLGTVLSGFVLAALAPFIARFARPASGWILAALPATLAVILFRELGPIAAGEVIRESFTWIPGLDVELSFRLDGLALLMAGLITGIGTLVFIYAGAYLHGNPRIGRFFAYLLLFMASMLGVVLADNVVALFLFWELTSLTSFFLIGFNNEALSSRKAALQALLVTGSGGLILLVGLLLMGAIAGTYELSEIAGQRDALLAHSLYLPILLCIFAGAITKSAQFPFHFWLPNAMEAPTPVSAYLHSATMVKAGVYLLARVNPILGGTDPWLVSLKIIGAATMLVGAYLALMQVDYKRVLAYSTMSALGTMVLLLGIGTPPAIQAMVLVLLAHGLYKGALFLVAGAVDHETGTRSLDRLSGLRRAMPITAAAALLAALSLAGLMPLFSFIGKELFFTALLEGDFLPLLFVVVAVLATMLLVAVAGIVGLRPFFGHLGQTPRTPHEPSLGLLLGPLVLAIAGLVLGLVPRAVEPWALRAASSAVLGEAEPITLSLWHGFNAAFLMSLLTLAGGFVIFKGWINLHHTSTWMQPLLRRGPAHWYERSLDLLNGIARRQTAFFQNGLLRNYAFVLVAITTVSTATVFLMRVGFPTLRDPSGTLLHEFAVGALIVAAAILTFRARSRLTAIMALGVVGYGAALVYVLFGAPDLAMTQFLFETLTVLLFVFVLPRMPRLEPRSSRSTRARDAVLSISAGVLMTGLVLLVLADTQPSPVSEYYAENSYTEGHGRNVVNVILVDFRALDTLGEITVLAVSGLGVYALLKARKKEDASP
jgi:multicomponent Na+:H+ antiporter subunit A